MDILTPGGAQIGTPEDLIEGDIRVSHVDDADGQISLPPRGLGLKSLKIDKTWDKVLFLFETASEIFYTSVAFDLSGASPVVLPPAKIDENAFYHRMERGDTIHFTLGEGAPLFPSRSIERGLALFLMVFDHDGNIRDVGETMAKVHEDLQDDNSLVEALRRLITSPTETIADEALSVATAAMQPLATILRENGNDFLTPFQGYWSAAELPWTHLTASQNGVTIELVEFNGSTAAGEF